MPRRVLSCLSSIRNHTHVVIGLLYFLIYHGTVARMKLSMTHKNYMVKDVLITSFSDNHGNSYVRNLRIIFLGFLHMHIRQLSNNTKSICER